MQISHYLNGLLCHNRVIICLKTLEHAMIIRWHLQNFKSIQEMEYLQFGKLTIFAGANSSGKSTVIQSILLLMQTLQNRENVPLQLNGDLVTLGQVEDVWYRGNITIDGEPVPLSIDMVLDEPERGDHARWYIQAEFLAAEGTRVYFSRGDYGYCTSEGSLESLLTVWRDGESFYVKSISDELQILIRDRLQQQGLSEIAIPVGAGVMIEDFMPREAVVNARRLSDDFKWETVLITPLTVELSPENFKETLPVQHWEVIRDIGRSLNLSGLEVKDAIGRNRRSVHTLQEYRAWFATLTGNKVAQFQNQLAERLPEAFIDGREWHPLPVLDRLESAVTKTFTSRIRYLGANRLPPTMVYDLGTSSVWSEVGISGENAAGALREYGQKIIRFWDPEKRSVLQATLSEALIIWMQFFKLIDRIESIDRGKLGTQVNIYAPGLTKALDLTSVGFGTSQILPIIIQGLLTPPDALFIVEQPEVHLHPHVQAQLAWFFFGLTRAGVQCIIETHSEHIVNQLRVVIAQGDAQLRQDVKIYFAERDPDYGTSFEEVKVNDKGKITNWPKGFMDESSKLARELLQAATQTKEKES